MILITGGTGTSGIPILKQLAATGVKFRVLARDPTMVTNLGLSNIEAVKGDLSNPSSLAAALKGIDRALLNSGPDPRQAELQGNLVTAAKAAGVKYIVKFSAMGAATASPMRFMRLHAQTEEQIRASGMAYTFLRPTFFFQNLLALAGMAKQGAIYQPTTDGRSGFVDVRDIAGVAVKALTEPGHEGKTYELTGPHAISYHDVAGAFTDILGKEIRYVDVPLATARQEMLAMGIPEWVADGINELSAQMRAGAFARLSTVVADVLKRPPISLGQFVRDYADAFILAK